jgi:uncharacterized protein YbaR (Trm112 family)
MVVSPELLAILVCPESRQPLVHIPAGLNGPEEWLYCRASRLRYRIEGGVPVLLVDEADRLDADSAAAVEARIRGAAEAP